MPPGRATYSNASGPRSERKQNALLGSSASSDYAAGMPTIARIGRLIRPLTIICNACGHSVTWAPAEARRRLGGDCMVTDARRRLTCSVCGQRERLVDFA